MDRKPSIVNHWQGSFVKSDEVKTMRLLLSLSAGLGMILAAAAAVQGRADADLKPGDRAPDFSLPGSDGKTYTLADFKGKRAVVLAWFPKAFTGG